MANKVLFVCVGNSCRSQMAEGFARSMGMDAESAGTEPTPAVNQMAQEVMAEDGVDLSGQHPKLLDMDRLNEFSRTITMGCGVAESCPSLHTDEDWELDDPVGLDVAEFRRIRDEVKARVKTLKAQLDQSTA